MPKGKETKKKNVGAAKGRKIKKIGKSQDVIWACSVSAESCLSRLRGFVSAAKSLEQGVVSQEELGRIVSEMKGVLNELQDQNSTT